MNLNKDVILGAIIGDIVGSRFELNNNKNGKQFEFLNKFCRFTDDTTMTLAVAKAFLDSNSDYSDLKDNVIKSMVELGKKYPNCGYGPSFCRWINSETHEPYKSYGNGSAMRISSVGVIAKDIDEIKKFTTVITNVSHNHPDSINGSEVVAIAIYMSLKGKDKEEIKQYIENNYFKINDLKINEMKPRDFHINCVETVKQALSSFMESTDFEDAIRNAISLGGDSDTLASITGGIASAYYGIPDEINNEALKYLDDYLIDIHNRFYNKFNI